jgi:RimJ/RimL family protein N-acetyltransferase
VLPQEPLVDGPTMLRDWRGADVPLIAAACQDPEIPRWTHVPEPYRELDARAYLNYRREAMLNGQMAPFAIVRADDPDVLLGSISLLRMEREHRRTDVGYWLAAAGRGQGHATRALKLVRGWGTSALRFERVQLLAATGNVASQKVAERAGFSREGVLRSYSVIKGRRLDMVMYGWLATS